MSGKKANKDENRIRYTLELNKRLDGILDRLADRNGTTKAEVVRFAIDFLDAGAKISDDGMQVGGWIENESGQVVKERVIVGL